MVRTIDLIPLAAATQAGVAAMPVVLRESGLRTAIHRSGHAAYWQAVPAIPKVPVVASLAAGRQPWLIGGDFSATADLWHIMGEARAMPCGLLWVGGALDPERAARLVGAPLPSRHVCLVGVHDPEGALKARLGPLGVRIIDAVELHERGVAAALSEAMARVSSAPGGFGLRVGFDVLNEEAATGAWLSGLQGSACRHGCLVVALGGYDALHDHDGRQVRLALRLAEALGTPGAAELMRLEQAHGAANYAPLPVVLARASGCWAWDVAGRPYLDMMSAYSAASFGHGHPRLLATLADQAGRLAVTSRAYFNSVLPAYLRRLTEVTGYERALPVNTGLEAVETALKAARKWGHTVKGIPADQAEIIACDGNFHGRSITIVGLSSESQYRRGFGPFPPGLRRIPFGDPAALEAAITPQTAAFLVEPIQGEGGIVVPPDGYLRACAEICRRHQVLLICDEVQTGLGRTGTLMAWEHDGARPDGLILGKALGGGLYPVSAFLADRAVMDVFRPGDHGSTFGGNALAAAIGLAALDLLEDEDLVARSARLGGWLMARLRTQGNPLIREVRGRGLLIGLELDTRRVSARQAAEALLGAGILTKETHDTVIRLAPPLIVEQDDLEWAVARIVETFDRLYAEQTCLV